MLSEKLLLEAISYYDSILPSIDNSNVIFTQCSGGINNFTYFVDYIGRINETQVTNRYVLRIYNNGNNINKVIYEHKLLLLLQEISKELPYEVPNLYVINDKTYHVLSNNSFASLFRLIPGSLVGNQICYELGVACGQLTNALGKVTKSFTTEEFINCPTKPYYDLYQAHHSITKEIFYNEINSNKYNSYRQYIDILLIHIQSMEYNISNYLSILPKQMIHGDLHYNNILSYNNQVTGLLDFEFCSYDWRAMELAICLSKYASEPDPTPYFIQFIQGYSIHTKLSIEEIQSIPELIKLRILNNVIYFTGRIYSNEDSMNSLTDRLESYCQRINWIDNNNQILIEELIKYMIDNNL